MERGRIIVNNTDYTGSFVTPNPSEPPTKDLNTLEIEGEVFNIAGSGSGGGGSNLIVDAQIYSLEEKQIGVWVDGRPLYQKTFERNITLASGSWTSTGDSVLNGKAIDAEVTAIGQGSDTIPVWCEIGSDGHIELLNIRGSGQVTITHYTVRYFKTTDAVGSGGFQAYGFTPIIYSTEERVVGVGENNKPLYQKTIESGSIPADSVITTGLTNIETYHVIAIEMISISNNAEFSPSSISMYDYQGAGTNYGTIYFNNNELQYVNNSRINAIKIRAVIQYTKTTDTAGSGSYTTLGVPAHHYDGNEKIIGTWFGETLYERTLNIGSISSTNDGYVIGDKATLKIKDCVELYGKCTYEANGEKQTIPLPNYNNSAYYIRVYYESDLGIMLDMPSLNGKAGIWFEYSNDAFQYYNNDIYITIRYTKTTD